MLRKTLLALLMAIAGCAAAVAIGACASGHASASSRPASASTDTSTAGASSTASAATAASATTTTTTTATASAAVQAPAGTLETWGVSAKPTKVPGHHRRHRRTSAGAAQRPGANPRARAGAAAVSGVPGTIVQVSTSNSDTYALTSSGAVYAVGDGARGELGNGSRTATTASAVRVDFPSGVRIAKLANPSGLDGGLAIDTSGHAWAWGDNGQGQDCRGSSAPLLKPVELPLSDVTLAAGALQHTIFDAGGRIVSCGAGPYGQLGNGTEGSAGQSGHPVAVKGLPSGRAVAVTASWGDAGVLMANGHYYDWGFNRGGQVGDGQTAKRSTAYEVSLPASVTQASQGGSTAANGQTMVLLSDGQLWEWGNGAFGQMGDGKLVNETRPIQLTEPAGTHFSTVASGGATNYAIDTRGELWAWGRNNSGQVGDGHFSARVKRPVSDHLRVRQVASTASEAAALSAG